MYITLADLIQYWKDRQLPNPPMTSIPWQLTLEATILFLQELHKIQGEQK